MALSIHGYQASGPHDMIRMLKLSRLCGQIRIETESNRTTSTSATAHYAAKRVPAGYFHPSSVEGTAKDIVGRQGRPGRGNSVLRKACSTTHWVLTAKRRRCSGDSLMGVNMR